MKFFRSIIATGQYQCVDLPIIGFVSFFRDAITVACINCLTSIYAGFVVFACLGFMAEQKNVTMENVAKAGEHTPVSVPLVLIEFSL